MKETAIKNYRANLQIAVDLAGGQTNLAKACGGKVRQGHVWKWLNKSKTPVPPAKHCKSIIKACDYKVTAHQLRPDLFPENFVFTTAE